MNKISDCMATKFYSYLKREMIAKSEKRKNPSPFKK